MSSATTGRIAGFFAILAGGLVAVGAFPAWVTLHSGEIPTPHNAFDIISGLRDASICFALAALLLVVGFALTARPFLVARGLGALAGISAAVWAGLLFFLLVPQAHDWIAPSATSASVSIDLGLWLIAGGGLFGMLAALTAAAARRRPMLPPATLALAAQPTIASVQADPYATRRSRTALGGVIAQLPALGVQRPMADRPTPGIQKEDAALLLKAAEAAGLRDEVIIRLLLLNGLRASEVVQLRIADVGEERGHRTLQVRRRGGRITIEALSPGTRHALERLLAEREDSAPEAPLLVGRGGKPLTRHALARVTRRLGRVLSIGIGPTDPELNPHELRHSFITLGLDAGVSLLDMQRAAGHADPRTTADDDRRRKALDTHPSYVVERYLASGPSPLSPSGESTADTTATPARASARWSTHPIAAIVASAVPPRRTFI